MPSNKIFLFIVAICPILLSCRISGDNSEAINGNLNVSVAQNKIPLRFPFKLKPGMTRGEALDTFKFAGFTVSDSTDISISLEPDKYMWLGPLTISEVELNFFGGQNDKLTGVVINDTSLITSSQSQLDELADTFHFLKDSYICESSPSDVGDWQATELWQASKDETVFIEKIFARFYSPEMKLSLISILHPASLNKTDFGKFGLYSPHLMENEWTIQLYFDQIEKDKYDQSRLIL